jgi:hypothetical protein
MAERASLGTRRGVVHAHINAGAAPALVGSFAKTLTLIVVFAFAILIAVTPFARADTRDAVIAGMFRCATITSTRTWLDCYYGSAQPLRAALGLPPAPVSQVRLSQEPPAGSPIDDLSERYQATGGALQCNRTAESREWLECYYAAAQPVRALLGLSPAPQVRLASPIPGTLAPTTPAQPLVTSATLDAAPQFVARFPLTAQMTSYSFNRFGMFTVTLNNGQMWRQESGDTNFAHWDKAASHYVVRITRGALNSLNLRVTGSAVAYKVQQIN